MKSQLVFLIIISFSLFINPSFTQSVHYVHNGNDSGEGSLRAAISGSNNGDTIKFENEVDSIRLTSTDLKIDKSLIVTGNENLTVITKSDTIPQFRIFTIQSTDTLTVEFNNLVICHGNAPDGDEEDKQGHDGGGIYLPENYHRLSLTNCLVDSNYAGDGCRKYSDVTTGKGGSGGGIFSNSKLELYNCEINYNSAGNGAWASSGGDWSAQHAGAGGSGGGIFCANDIILDDCHINYNKAGAGGHASGTTYSSGGNGGAGGSGGGIYVVNGTCSVTGSDIGFNSAGKGGVASNNQSSCSGGAAGNGGAIYLSGSTITINHCLINENKAGNGGGATGNEMGHGRNGGNGGGIYFSNCQINMDSIDIVQNLCGSGGGSGGPTLGVSPGSGGNGGGIYMDGCHFIINGSLIKENTCGNGASTSYYYSGGGHGGNGGGIYNINGAVGSVILGSRLENNHAGNGGRLSQIAWYTYNSIANGGSGGGLAEYASSTRIVNCLFSGNRSGNAIFKDSIPPDGDYWLPNAGYGGGIFIKGTDQQIINTTVANNYAGKDIIVNKAEKSKIMVSDNIRGKGGGIYTADSSINAINSIIAKNYIINDSIFNDIEGTCSLNYSILSTDTLANIASGNGNLINFDPLFVSFPDDYSLLPGSPGINNGTPDTTGLFLPITDLAGNPRVYNTIDMGAYEFQGEPQDQYFLSTEKLIMDTVLFGNSKIDSLYICNYGAPELAFTKIQTGSPFSISMDSETWNNNLYNISIPAGNPVMTSKLYIRFDGILAGEALNHIVFQTESSTKYVEVSGYCKSTEEIQDLDPVSHLAIQPNPFSNRTKITFFLEQSSDIETIILNLSGIKVDEFSVASLNAGFNELIWINKSLPSGVYILQIKSGLSSSFSKMVIK